MNFYIILSLFIVAIFLFDRYIVLKLSTKIEEKKESCPPDENSTPHKWTYDTNDQMFCKKCNRKPGIE